MDNTLHLLVLVLYNESILKCAIKISPDLLPKDFEEFPMEYKEKLSEFLPLHVKSCGPIVAIEEIFNVHVVRSWSNS